MPAVTRVGDRCTGHDDCPPVPLQTGSANVFINGRPVGRVGDPYETHSCPVHDPHVPHLAAGAANVFINGIPVSRVGDVVDCGGVVMEGSGNVFVGDGGSGSGSGNDGGSRTEGTGGSEGSSGGDNDGGAGSQGGSGHGEEVDTTGQAGTSDGPEDGSGNEPVSVPLDAAALAAQIAANLEVLEKHVEEEGSTLDKQMLCLAEIAAAQAERQSAANDRQGWLYLHDMLDRWFGGEANTSADSDPNAFWIDWNWLMTYEAFREGVKELKDPEYLFSDKARDALTNILQTDGKFTDKREYFDYTVNDGNFLRWKKYYFQRKELGKMTDAIFGITGLYAALAGYSIRALAKGYVEPVPGGNLHKVCITGIGIYARDTVNFEGHQYLGDWKCEGKSFVPVTTPTYYSMTNGDFNDFRQKYGYGSDFMVLSPISFFELNYEYIHRD